jgi:hypothetical protein
MATFDQLSADQRAIVELLLKQGKSYDELADMLGLPAARVRELARDALAQLSPVSAAGVDDDWRGQVADYLLGQQSGPEATATRGHLRRSEAARGWSRSTLDSLDQFYDRTNLPTIPEGEPLADAAPRRERRRDRDDADERPTRRELSPAASAVVRRRRMAGAGVLGVLVLLIVLVWPIGLVMGDDDGGDKSDQASNEDVKLEGQLVLRPVNGAQGAGIAVIAQRGDDKQLIVQARLTANKNREAYEVWLYNSKDDARSLGAQVTDKDGNFQGAGPLPEDYKRYKFIDVSREKVDTNKAHSGVSVLRGTIADIAPVPENQQQGTGTTTTPAPSQTTTTP